MNTPAFCIAAGLCAIPAAAQPFTLQWSSISAGGATATSAGPYTLGGTIGQPSAGPVSAGPYSLQSGFWSAPPPVGAVCYANCDHSTTPPILNVLDFSCFLNKFSAGDTYANCDHSTTPPVLNVLDFSCFLNHFAAGCS